MKRILLGGDGDRKFISPPLSGIVGAFTGDGFRRTEQSTV
jgi:hypothetical protein